MLKKGSKFKLVQSYRGCKEPMTFEVLDINRQKNELKVKCTSFEGYSHEEKWNDLDVTEEAFEIGEYVLLEQ